MRILCSIISSKISVIRRCTNAKQGFFISARRGFSSLYYEHENSYYRKALGTLSPQYCSSPVLPKLKLEEKISSESDVQFLTKRNHFERSPQVLCETFVILTKFVHLNSKQTTLENPEYKPLCIGLASIVPDLSDDQLCEVLTCLTFWPSTDSTKSFCYKTVWNALDRECAARSSRWDSTKLLQVAYLWNTLGLNRITNYNYAMIDVLCQRLDSLNLNDIIHLLFFINLQRKISSKLMHQIEKRLLSENIDQLEMDQLGVLALGFFKSQTTMSSNLLIKKILAKTQENLHTSNTFNISSILKFLRFSITNINCLEDCKSFQKQSLKSLSSLSKPTLLHLALLNMRRLACDEDLLKYLMDAFTQDLESIRLKEFSHSLFCVSQILPETEQSRNYARTVIEELLLPHREKEIFDHPHQLISLVLYTVYMNVYSEKLIDKCLSDEFLKIAEDNASWEWEREIYALDASVGLECPDYKGNRLSTARKSAILKRLPRIYDDNSRHNQLVQEISKNISKALGGHIFSQPCKILPHYHHKDLVMIKDEKGKWKKIPSHFHQNSKDTILQPQKNEQWIALFIGGYTFYNFTNNQLIGIYRTKCRQLHQLGYNVIEIPYLEYYNEKYDDRVNYIKEKLKI